MPDIQSVLLSLVPADGSAIGNITLRSAVGDKLDRDVDEAEYAVARDALVAAGTLVKGAGRGGSVRLASAADAPVPSEAVTAPLTKSTKADKNAAHDILSYRHADKRKNNPEVGKVTPDNDPFQPKTKWAYDPHIDPALQFDVGRSQVEKLIDDALASGDKERMHAALAELKRMGQPYLNWAGKAEHTSFEVDTVSLHVHERIDPASILAAVRKAVVEGKAGSAFQMGLFDAPFEKVPLREAIDFYRHDRGWANRLIAGDSLLVMNSLLKKESMGGRVQMVYFDPPYGIKYGSNFQPFVNKREVKDGKDEDLTQEPEMIKAFRDTWELGIHSYLTYLRDRLLLAKELLHESGSIFVQISDENLHHVRELLDDVFGAENFCRIITLTKTAGFGATLLPVTQDYLVWYAKKLPAVKFHQLYLNKVGSGTVDESTDFGNYNKFDELGRRYRIDNLTGQNNNVLSCLFEFNFRNRGYSTPASRQWKTTEVGMTRLARASRLEASAAGLYYKRLLADFELRPITDKWGDTGSGGFTDEKLYVVQTGVKVVERCMLLTTDPGDLVFDPTCGSGTTAFAGEKWGRRWITCDTSRVAVTLAKQRMSTATFDWARPQRDPAFCSAYLAPRQARIAM